MTENEAYEYEILSLGFFKSMLYSLPLLDRLFVWRFKRKYGRYVRNRNKKDYEDAISNNIQDDYIWKSYEPINDIQ